MDKLKEKVQQLKAEVDAANARFEVAEKKLVKVKSQLVDKESEAEVFHQRIAALEEEVSHAEERIGVGKLRLAEEDLQRGQSDGLLRKIQLLETDLFQVQTKAKETSEKLNSLTSRSGDAEKLVVALEKEKTDVEAKNDEMVLQYAAIQKELDETMKSLHDL